MPRTVEGIKRERLRMKRRMKALYDEAILAGEYYRCGVICEINLKTNKPYHACAIHRKIEGMRTSRKNRKNNAGMVELADTTDLKSVGRKAMRVRSPLSANQ